MNYKILIISIFFAHTAQAQWSKVGHIQRIENKTRFEIGIVNQATQVSETVGKEATTVVDPWKVYVPWCSEWEFGKGDVHHRLIISIYNPHLKSPLVVKVCENKEQDFKRDGDEALYGDTTEVRGKQFTLVVSGAQGYTREEALKNLRVEFIHIK